METLILSFSIGTISIVLIYFILQNHSKRVENSLKKHNKRLNNLEQRILKIKSILNSAEYTFTNLESNTKVINDSIKNINHELKILLGIISEFAILGSVVEKKQEELIVSPKNGVLHIIDSRSFPLSNFVIYDRADNKIDLGIFKNKYYNDVVIEEKFIQHKQEVFRNSKIVRISFSANLASIIIKNNGKIINLDKIKNSQEHIKKGEELFLFKEESGKIIRFLAPITGLFNTKLKIGDHITSGDQVFTVYTE